jgi:hypothetical protein
MDEREFEYSLEELPPGRLPFRRWRWELWQGAWLLACGWRVSPGDAERAIRTAASRRAHELLGVRALHPDRAHTRGSFLYGSTVRVDCGPITCVLAPRREPAAGSAAA